MLNETFSVIFKHCDYVESWQGALDVSLPGVPTSSRVAASTASEQQPPQPFKETKPEAIPLTVMKLQTRAEASTASVWRLLRAEAVILVAKIIPAPQPLIPLSSNLRLATNF